MPDRPRPSAPSGSDRRGGPTPGNGTASDAAMAHLVWTGMPQLMAVLDAQGRIRATNPAWLPLLGLEAAHLRGQPLLAFAHPDDQAAARRWLRVVLDGGGPASFQGRWRCANGQHLSLNWTLALRGPLACAIGQPALPARAPPEPALALQVRQHTLRSVGRLVSGLSHELNNLLQVLRNTLELVQARPADAAQVAAWAGSALRVVDRGGTLADRLQAFAGTQHLTPQTVQVAALLQGLRARLQALLGPRTPLRLDLPPGPSLAMGDAAQLELALLNLALNAVDAMPAGGWLAVRLGRAHIEDDAELATGDYVVIDVSDSGSGMSAAVRERAFEPFFTTKALGQGSGLGLSQVWGFLQQSGGAVRLEPPGTPGHTVRLLLPAAGDPPATGAAAAAPQAPAAQPHLLVVVDDADRRQLLLSALNLLGYADVQAVDAAGARRQIEQQPPDVVVLGLPARPVGPDELARRARQRRPGVGVVRLDALATAAELPLDMDALARAIGRATPALP